ncbi:MAG: Bacterial alpha-L-rhamnosidase [Rhodoglobus sp.]|nr:Bacterial alpha-L-rhamnosidase [Rhodoglobus sp.]
MNWHARMIAADLDFDGAPLLRREFVLDGGHGEVVAAKLTLSALGVVEAWLNGQRVSPDLLTPGWTSYEWRVRYSEYDVTGLLAGSNVLGLALGNGWYRGRLGWSGKNGIYGDTLGAFAQLEVRYADGHVGVVGTDDSWTSGPSAVTANDLYDGQTIDARRDGTAWLEPGFDADGWTGVHELDFDLATLAPNTGPAVRRFAEVEPVTIATSPSGATLVDFGQNLVGFVRARVQGPAGAEIVIRHAEVLEHGELGTRPLRSALATDRYILSGGLDEFEPTFTFHGFRYAEISGWPGELSAESITAVAVGSELQRTGTFASSNPLLNRFHENVVWGMRSNFLSVPTDCPQRDERLGWTGDIAAFAPTAAYLFDVEAFLKEWLLDVALEQSHANGVIPYVVPDPLKYLDIPAEITTAQESTAVWSDAGVWVPWNLYEAYGDTAVLEAQFDSMAAHVRHVQSLLSPSGLWDTGFQFGDWLDPDAPPEDPAAAKADTGVVATVSAYHSARIVADAAAALGRQPEVVEFTAIAAGLRAAFTEHYLDAGVILSDCTTVYSLAIVFDILSPADREFAGNRLAELAAASGYLISTGFAGTPFICDALSQTGHVDDAYRLLMQEECPSWLYPVTMGATTIWERWDAMLPDGSINPGQMTSFNHYALGAVADWMHRVVGGISPLTPGYGEVLIAPQPGGGLTEAETAVETRHGRVAVQWSITEGELRVRAEVPAGVRATVRLPGREEFAVEGGAVDETVAWASR